MNTLFFLTAFTLGFLGSFHCAGMCGPIALMLPQTSGSQLKILFGRLIYNSGRIVTYIVLGFLFGSFGWAVALKGFQREVSILAGVVILLSTIFSWVLKKRIELFNGSSFYVATIRNRLKKLFAKKTKRSLFLIGVLNGMLPCGFVYMAIAGTSTSGSIGGGMLYMALFGLGTFPMMMVLTVVTNYLGIKFRKIFSKVSVSIAIVLALFLIFRGFSITEECCKSIVHLHKPLHCIPAGTH
jgi:uncharacterized protein